MLKFFKCKLKLDSEEVKLEPIEVCFSQF